MVVELSYSVMFVDVLYCIVFEFKLKKHALIIQKEFTARN